MEEIRLMASRGELEERLSRMEATAAREGNARDNQFSLRLLREWSTPDLRRLEGLIERVESGDPSAALSAAEQEWIDETMKRAALAVDAS